MAEAAGFSHLYPVLPIMNVLSMFLCLLLIPGFWKTRIVAMVTLVVWILLGNLICFISMIQWRGNTNDVPILADFITFFWHTWNAGCPASMACFAHFTWQRLQPVSMRQLYDTRRRNNLIHFVVSVIVPVLWAPLYLASSSKRYVIIEDLGPSAGVRYDWPGVVISMGPQFLSYLAVLIFNVLAFVTYWRMKHHDIESDILKHHSSVRTRKLLLLALFDIPLAAYGIFKAVHYWGMVELVAPTSFAENIASLQYVFRKTRSAVEEFDDETIIGNLTGSFSAALLGFYLFAWFGCGEEVRKAYREALMKPVRLMGLAVEEDQPHVGSSPSPWSCITLRRPKLPQGLANFLLLTRPNAPPITPYTSAVLRDHGPEPSATAANNNASSPVRNLINLRRQGKAPSREPVRRLSMHKSPAATLNQANAIPSGSNIPLRRLSHHKSPFTHLVPPNVPAIAGPDASGSVAPRLEGTDSARRQEKFALRPPRRRLSFHKPIFVPLAPANAGAIANELEPTMPLVEAPRDLISEITARLQAESVLDSGVAPPAFSSPSTSTAPPPFSAPFVSMAPPPSFSIPSTSTALPPPFSSPSSSTAPPLLLEASTPNVPQPLSTPIPPHVEETSSTRQQEISIQTSRRAHRLSYHKPPFVPLGRPNGSSIATPEASRSTPPRMEDVNNNRRQENFAPRARPRRLSYHKPAFVPLAPPENDTSTVANASGPTIPLVESPRDLIGDRNARLQAENVLDIGVAPPAFSSPSTSTAPPSFSALFASMSPPPAFLSASASAAPPPLSDVSASMAATPVSTPSTMTPAPPYQHLNPFQDHVL